MHAPLSLTAMQRSWADRLRNPRQQPLPDGASARAMRVYEKLLYSNMKGFLNQCFPVAQSVTGRQLWDEYCTTFFAEWPCTSPFFRNIPQAFTAFAQAHATALKLPDWLPELLHYEWVELAVETAPDTLPEYGTEGMAVAPTLRLLCYHWPVHTIAANAIAQQPQTTFLAVYRDASCTVRFVQLTAISARLMELLLQHQADTSIAFTQLAQDTGSNIDAISRQALPQIQQWLKTDMLIQRPYPQATTNRHE